MIARSVEMLIFVVGSKGADKDLSFRTSYFYTTKGYDKFERSNELIA